MVRKTHSDYCDLLCICCLKKSKTLRSIVNREKETGRPPSVDFTDLLRNHFWVEYSGTNPDLPRKICDSCRLKLLRGEEISSRPAYEGKLYV